MKDLLGEEVNLLRHNARRVVRELGLLNDAYCEIGVTLAERHLLIELASCTSPTIGEIAERLLVDKSTVSRLIAKAVKKGYIKCLSDKKDRRKRFLYLTEVGKQTLNAFEPIAFNQTKEALLSLATGEIELVYQGVALYAKGLQQSRVRKQLSRGVENSDREVLQIEGLKEISGELEGVGLTLNPYRQEQEEGLYEIFREVVESGSQFPYESSSREEFYRQFLAPQSRIYVCCSLEDEVVGAFCIRPNFSGRVSHIANAIYMVRDTYRGRGIGTLLVKGSLEIAKNLGFRAMQFNRASASKISY